MTSFASPSTTATEQSGPALRRRGAETTLSTGAVVLFLAAHVPLVLLVRAVPVLGAVQALVALLAGLVLAASTRSPQRVAYVAAYVAGAQVLWRMTHTPIFWEFGKYAIALMFFMASLRMRPLRSTCFPIVFFALLIPSSLLTISHANYDFESFPRPLSFNLSGPLALAASAAFFSRVRLTPARIQRMFVAFLGPAIGIAFLCILSIETAEKIVFTTESNATTSGGFGPNQVSCTFGFGLLLAFLLATFFLGPKQHGLRWLMLGLLILLGVHSALTLSRSGLYLAGGGVVVAAGIGLRSARTRTLLLLTAGLVFVIGEWLVVPQLNAFTAGKFAERFSDTGVTNRDRIAMADLYAWRDNPLFGVGPGMAKEVRARYYRGAAAHTELSRLLAEHGTLGFLALCMLLHSAWQALRRAKTVSEKACVASLVVFALLYMASNAMRLALPSLAFGLTFASFEND